jgi:hypothetical protein
VIDLVV